MARRVVPADPSIGDRIRARREKHGWSARHAAQRAGVAHTTWSRVEKGERRADRYLIADFAAALECSVADLTGQPQMPADHALKTAHARVQPLWRALVEIAPDEPSDRAIGPVEGLAEQVGVVSDLQVACDYAGCGQMLIGLLPDLHAAMVAGPDGRIAADLMVRATYSATMTLRNLGYLAEGTFAAERCRQSAERLDEPAALAVADFARAQMAIASGSFRRAATIASRAADALGTDTAPEVLGMLHLTSALAELVERRDDAFAHLAEAEKLAARTGETTSWTLMFGPTNVGIWKVGLEVDAGEPGRAVETAASVNPTLVPSKARQSTYFVDLARALTDLDGQRDNEALRMLLTAERLAPQRVRSAVAAQATARFLLDRSRRGSPLYGLCERMGVA